MEPIFSMTLSSV